MLANSRTPSYHPGHLYEQASCGSRRASPAPHRVLPETTWDHTSPAPLLCRLIESTGQQARLCGLPSGAAPAAHEEQLALWTSWLVGHGIYQPLPSAVVSLAQVALPCEQQLFGSRGLTCWAGIREARARPPEGHGLLTQRLARGDSSHVGTCCSGCSSAPAQAGAHRHRPAASIEPRQGREAPFLLKRPRNQS